MTESRTTQGIESSLKVNVKKKFKTLPISVLSADRKHVRVIPDHMGDVPNSASHIVYRTILPPEKFSKEREMDWRHRSACLEEDPELFFPIGNTGPAITQIEEAKAICRRCDVMEVCLKWAIENGQDAGVWGGMSEDERRSLKRRNARARRAG